MVRPRLVRGILTSQGEILEDMGLKQLKGQENGEAEQVIREEISRQMVEEVLEKVVENKSGTGHVAYLDDYRVFGKTGTAQVPRPDGRGYYDGKYVSSFLAGAPAEDPRICVLIMVREPDKSLGLGYTGGKVAAPAVKEVLQYTLTYLQVPKSVR